MNLNQLAERASTQAAYFRLRTLHPDAKPATCLAYARGEEGDGELGFEQFQCGREFGHQFRCTGTQYGGDDERWGGEGRCLCSRCGADGDA